MGFSRPKLLARTSRWLFTLMSDNRPPRRAFTPVEDPNGSLAKVWIEAKADVVRQAPVNWVCLDVLNVKSERELEWENAIVVSVQPQRCNSHDAQATARAVKNRLGELFEVHIKEGFLVSTAAKLLPQPSNELEIPFCSLSIGIGIEVGYRQGTLSLYLRRRADDALCILTARHVVLGDTEGLREPRKDKAYYNSTTMAATLQSAILQTSMGNTQFAPVRDSLQQCQALVLDRNVLDRAKSSTHPLSLFRNITSTQPSYKCRSTQHDQPFSHSIYGSVQDPNASGGSSWAKNSQREVFSRCRW